MSNIKTWKATSSQCVSVIPRLSVLNEFNPLNLVVECGFFLFWAPLPVIGVFSIFVVFEIWYYLKHGEVFGLNTF